MTATVKPTPPRKPDLIVLKDPAAAPPPLVDSFQRRITYLRLSVTDRCDLRCSYCMPERMTFLPKKDVLSLEELYDLATGFIARGGFDFQIDAFFRNSCARAFRRKFECQTLLGEYFLRFLRHFVVHTGQDAVQIFDYGDFGTKT